MRLLRIAKIFRVFIRHRLDRLVPDDLVLPLWVKFFMAPLKLLPVPAATAAVSLRLAF